MPSSLDTAKDAPLYHGKTFNSTVSYKNILREEEGENNFVNIKMADTNNEYFNIGSIVNCKTCFNEEIQGEVLAFDQHVKILTLSILLL